MRPVACSVLSHDDFQRRSKVTSIVSTTAAGVLSSRISYVAGNRYPSRSADRVRIRTRHDLVTLASIVEKEAGRRSERRLIAAVYRNRLQRGMRLQADPTVLYAMGLIAKRVMYADLSVASPYNTYRVSGLPPGPIASPGSASLEAAMFPADTNVMFFVAFPDGHSQFTTSFVQHRAAVKRSRAARDSAASR